MTASAPIDRTRSTLLVLHTPVTWAPTALAIWTANVPIPPDAPLIRTFCPGCTCAVSRSACRAVIAARGTGVLGEGAADVGAVAESEDLVARAQIGDLRADLGDRAGDVRPSDAVPWSP